MNATAKRTRSKPKETMLTPIMMVHVYRYAKSGMDDKGVYQAIKVSQSTFQNWKKDRTDLVETLRLAREEDTSTETWHKYVYSRLSPELRELWDKIQDYDGYDDDGRPHYQNGVVLIEKMLDKHGKRIRQQLFLHALVFCNFSMSRAMAKVNVDKKTLEWWIQKEPEFAELVEEMKWHQDNFFEESFVQLVSSGDGPATVHAAKTRLKGRGYGATSEVNVNHSGSIQHNVLDLNELVLTTEVRAAIMDAMRQREETVAEQKKLAAMPVEYRMLEELEKEISGIPGEEL